MISGIGREGPVDVYYDSEWWPVYDELWDDRDAGAVCQSLGFTGPSSAVTALPTEDNARLLDLDCISTTTVPQSCSVNGSHTYVRNTNKGAGVKCKDTEKGKYM